MWRSSYYRNEILRNNFNIILLSYMFFHFLNFLTMQCQFLHLCNVLRKNSKELVAHAVGTRSPRLYLSQYSDWLRAARPKGRSSNPGGGNNFHFSMSSGLGVGSKQPLTQWIEGALPQGYSGRGVRLTTHLQLVPRSRTCGSIVDYPIGLHGVVLN
jgi:hypothetical protein